MDRPCGHKSGWAARSILRRYLRATKVMNQIVDGAFIRRRGGRRLPITVILIARRGTGRGESMVRSACWFDKRGFLMFLGHRGLRGGRNRGGEKRVEDGRRK